MSWSRVFIPQAVFARGVAILFLMSGLTGCGFAPVYGKLGSTSNGPKVAGVQVAPMSGGEVGLHLREALIDEITGSVEPARPTHSLYVVPSVVESSILVQPNAYVTRYNVSVSASFRLTELATGQVVATGQTRSVSAYNVIDSQYATLVGKRDAQERAADSVAHDIAMRVGLFFSRGTGATQAAAAPRPAPPAPPERNSGVPSVLNPSGAALPGTTGARNPAAPQ